MKTVNLFDDVLISPVREGANRLSIVSGYATATMASRHLSFVKDKLGTEIKVDVIVGMSPADGISRSNHRGFCELVAESNLGTFSCSYIVEGKTPVHSKVYVWSVDNRPVIAYTGSANYTQNAFSKNQREVLAPCDANKARDYYDSLIDDTVYCTYDDIEEYVNIHDNVWTRREPLETSDDKTEPRTPLLAFTGLEMATCPLVSKAGEIHTKAGLNWGQRERRNPNQAYIPVPADVQRSGFFPSHGEHFTVVTDDDKTLLCKRAQANGKAIETPQNNSLLGEYFRNRLGLANGAYVRKEDLIRYGRTSVDFYKIDDETYYMDFSPRDKI